MAKASEFSHAAGSTRGAFPVYTVVIVALVFEGRVTQNVVFRFYLSLWKNFAHLAGFRYVLSRVASPLERGDGLRCVHHVGHSVILLFFRWHIPGVLVHHFL